jgi:hypothetical protein
MSRDINIKLLEEQVMDLADAVLRLHDILEKELKSCSFVAAADKVFQNSKRAKAVIDSITEQRGY